MEIENAYSELIFVLKSQVTKWRNDCLKLENQLYKKAKQSDKFIKKIMVLKNENLLLKQKLKEKENE